MFWILELLIPLSEEERAPIAWQFRFLEHREREKIFDLGEPNFQNGGPDIHGGAHGALEVVVPVKDNFELKMYFIAIFPSTLVKY